MLVGFDELVLRCIDENAKMHIREAIKSYENSAYRASIVSSYIAVCFDLIEKLKSLAASGDGEAKSQIGQLQRLQTQRDKNDPNAILGLLEFERNLLELFRDKFDFFGQNEFEELARLRVDRNRCAHPTFANSSLPYSPTAELARLHISNAIALVLSQVPKQGTAALASLQATVLSTYFPKKVEEAVEHFQGTEILHARPALINAFVDRLVFGWATKGDVYSAKPEVGTAIAALVEMHRSIALPRVVSCVNKLFRSGDEKAIAVAAILALRVIEVGEQIDGASKVILKSWIKTPNTTGRGNAVARAFQIDWLKSVAVETASILTAEEVSKTTFNPPACVIQRAVDLYSSAKNWDEANKLASQCVMPFADKINENQIEEIFFSATQGKADLQGSHGFREFIAALYANGALGKTKLNKLTKKFGLEAYRP